ncbi:GNAT family N-acetyltransferase [Blastococcus sp. SYSU DS0619]
MADFPAVPAGFTARPLHTDDIPAVAALLVAAEPLDDTGEFPEADDVSEWWAGWEIDLARDGLAVRDADGALAGYAVVFAGSGVRDAFRVTLEGRVHPDRRGVGIGAALLDWQLARGAELHAERHPDVPARPVAGVFGTQPHLERLARRRGLTAERWYRTMARELAGGLPDLRPVPGVAFVPFTPDRDDEVRRAHNTAFTQHHGSTERDEAAWQKLFTGQRSFRPDLSVVAVEDGVVLGYALAYVYESDTKARGYREVVLGQIGVLPAARGRGIASSAIAAALRTAAGADCRTAVLDVDSDNVTGALRLYEGLGFETVRTQVSWARALPAVAASG